MPRKEFPRKVRAEIIERANGHCEDRGCGAVIKGTAFQIDHILPCELGGGNTAANAQLLCLPCHKRKTKTDVQRVRKSDRQRDKASGAIRPKGKIKNRGFAKKPRNPKPTLPPRPLYQETTP